MTRFAAQAARWAGASARLLGWSPDTFWAASPSDLLLALGASDEEGVRVGRDELEALLRAMPDQSKG